MRCEISGVPLCPMDLNLEASPGGKLHMQFIYNGLAFRSFGLGVLETRFPDAPYPRQWTLNCQVLQYGDPHADGVGRGLCRLPG